MINTNSPANFSFYKSSYDNQSKRLQKSHLFVFSLRGIEGTDRHNKAGDKIWKWEGMEANPKILLVRIWCNVYV